MNNSLIIAGFLSLFMVVSSGPLNAQERASGERYSFDFRGEPLHKVLEVIAKEAGIDMAYDPAIVEGITIFQRVQNEPVPDLLGNILADTRLDFLILSTGTVVIVQKVNENPAFGSYFGKVVEAGTGEPLPGASVMLADASGGTSTSSNGAFTLNRLITGTYTVIFSYVGYEPVAKTIDLKPGQDLLDKVSLKPKPVDFSPVVVTDHRPQMPNQINGDEEVNPNSEWIPSGKMRDVIRSLSLFQGVKYGLPMTDIHIQGGQPGEHRIRLDGVPVYNPNSFGQMFSAFSPYAISKVELHKAGYGVSEGSQVAGLIDINHDFGGIGRNRIITQADPLSVNLRGDLQFAGDNTDDASSFKVMGAVRRNYWNLFQEPTLDRTLQEWDDLDPLITNLLLDAEDDAALYQPEEHYSDVRFYDIHLASRYDINAYNTLSSSFYVGKNFVSTDLLRRAPQDQDIPEYLYARDEYQWNNFMGQVSFSQLISPRMDLNTQVSFTSNLLRHRYLIGTNDNPVIPNLGISGNSVLEAFQDAGAQNLVPTQRNTNRIQHLIARTDASYSITRQFNLEVGLQMDHVESQVDLSDLFYLPTETKPRSTFLSSYLSSNWTLGEYWKITLGDRLTYANSFNQVYTEPRASVQLDQPEAGIGYWSIRVSGGLYRQFINQYEITNPGPSSLVPTFTIWSHAGTAEVPKAWHLSGSFFLEPAEHTTINVEWFHKWQPTTYTVSYDNLLEGTAIGRSSFSAFAESTKMRTYGAGVRINQSFADQNVKLMLGYDYSFARIDLDSQFGRELPVPWNQPHRFQLRTLWRIFPSFTAVAKWEGIYGRTWGFRQSYYNFLFYESPEAFGDFSFSNPEDDRMDPFHQLDLSFIFKPPLEFMDMEIRADLINVLDRENTIDWSLRPEQPGGNGGYEIKKRTMPGFNPTISIQMDF